MTKIGIFPASGGLGGSTYKHLIHQLPNASDLILINRYPEKIEDEHKKAGVVVRQATYEDTAQQLKDAFAGVDVLFLISYPSHVHDYRTKVQIPAINAAHAAGVKHIFYSSLGCASSLSSKTLISKSKATVMQAHLDSERHLQQVADASDGNFTYTSIREGCYSESFPIYTSFLDPKNPPKNGEILIPHDGKPPGVSWVKRDELGEASAKLIARYAGVGKEFPEKYINAKVLLSGSKTYSLAESVAVLSDVIGTSLKIKEVSKEEYCKLPQILGVFQTEEKAMLWASSYDAIREGELGLVTPDLEEILGRKQEGYIQTLKAMIGSNQSI